MIFFANALNEGNIMIRKVLLIGIVAATSITAVHAKTVTKTRDSYDVAKADALRSARSICESYKAPFVSIDKEDVTEYSDGSIRVTLYYHCSQ